MILSRSQVPLEDTWDLSPLFSNEAAWEQEFQGLATDYKQIESFRGKLSSSVEEFFKALKYEEKLQRSIERLHQYASLRVTEDSSHAGSLEREGKLQSLLTKIAEASSFLAPEIQAIDEACFESYLANPLLEPWKTELLRLRRLKPHTLNDREERLLALSAPAVGGHEETFSQLTNVDMVFGTLSDEEGNSEALTQSSFSSFLQRPNRSLRKKAFDQFYEEFAAHRYTLASTLAYSIKGEVFQAKARNYPSSLASALFEDDIPISVYENLISTVRSKRELLFRYYDLRRRVLGLSELHVYDTYTPLIANIQSKVSFDEAIEKVLASLHPLGSEYTSVLRRGLCEERWCDRYENKGKRSGAFSSGTYDSPPYILMNYQEDVFSDIYTLAHEAGHSMHTWFSKNTQNFQNYHYPIFLAEVASTFNELLLTEYLLATTEDKRMRAYILNRQVDDLRATLFRQTLFAEFEKITHGAEEAGEALTLEFFRKTYRSLLEDYFGPGVTLDEALELECLRIPHFYNAFYVYKYATGISAAVTLANQVLKTGDAKRYLDFLKSGNTHFPIEALRLAGVDMTTPEPVQITLELFESRLEELENLL